MRDQAGNPSRQMPDSQIVTQMGTQAAQVETSAPAHLAGISPSAVRNQGVGIALPPFGGLPLHSQSTSRLPGLPKSIGDLLLRRS